MILKDFISSNGVYISENYIAPNSFEQSYLNIRKKEGRLYTDKELSLLPEINTGHIHFKEWLIRKESSNRLISYLKKKDKKLNILEVGCGNGWLSAKLAELPRSEVVGLDVNLTELKQASSVFSHKSNLHFAYGHIPDVNLKNIKFDIIVFAASIQYFRDFEQIINAALEKLTDYGEIHILDSPFYKKSDANSAASRSKNYYTSLGFPEMANYYFHHEVEDLDLFNSKILYNPRLFWNKVFNKKNPFYWVLIKK